MKKIYSNNTNGVNLVDESMAIYYENLPLWKKDKNNNPLLIAISPFDNMYLKKLVNYYNVIRRFEERNDNNIVDSISSNNASLFLPIDYFNGVDSIVDFDDLANTTITSYSGSQILSISGNSIIASGDGNVHSILLSNGTFIPLLSLGYGIDINNNGVKFTPSNIDLKYSEDGTDYLLNYGAIKRDGNFIPNNNLKKPLLDDEFGDEFIKGTSFLNRTPFKIDFLHVAAIQEYNFFDKSDVTIWGDEVRSSNNYDITNPYLWDMAELNQTYIYNNCLVKYQYWFKIVNSAIEDILLYNESLEDKDVCKMKYYTSKWEDLSTLFDDIVLCDKDNLI